MTTLLRDSWLQCHSCTGDLHNFLSPVMFQALLSDQPLTCHCQMSMIMHELKSSLESLIDSDTVEKAKSCTVEGNLSTVLELALAMPIQTLDDVTKMVSATSEWFVLGRWESFREGLSALGALEAVKTYPDSFRPLFCDVPAKLIAERVEQLFRPNTSPVGSSKALTRESLVLSRWSDYLQDIEDAEDSDITLSDILFFTTGCKVLPWLSCHRQVFAWRAVKVFHSRYLFTHPSPSRNA